MKNYVRTDLACESIDTSRTLPEGVEYKAERCGEIDIIRMKISSPSEADRMGKPQGSYLTFECGNIAQLDDVQAKAFSRLLSDELWKMTAQLVGEKKGGELCVLIAGLGNAKMTPDAIGPEVLSRLTVTNHIFTLDRELFESLGCCRLCSVATGVLGDTGIESLELIRGAVASVKPDLVVAVDALASRAKERLAATVQMSDTGIRPGAGVGNRRSEISRETLGVPVIALGVPTVIDTATLVFDALELAGVSVGDGDSLASMLEEGRGFFVAPKECDAITQRVACLLADAIDLAFGIKEG